MPRKRSPVLALAAAGVILLSGCSGGRMDADSATDLISSWRGIACNGSDVRSFSGEELAANDTGTSDIVVRAICDNEQLRGTLTQKRQVLTIYNSDEALETSLAGGCGSYLRVVGSTWSATTSTPEFATALTQQGGDLCED